MAPRAASTGRRGAGPVRAADRQGPLEPPGPGGRRDPGEFMARFALGSTAFQDGQAIPAQYACDGDDVSPPLSFEGLPPGAAALALVLDDPDAPGGTWIHWAWWNLPVQNANLAAGADVAALGATVGNNSWGRNGYGGPCPPSGTHRYQFHAYALGQLLDLPSGAGVETLRELADHHALAKAVLTGTYTRP